MVSANFMLTIAFDKHTRKYYWRKFQKCMSAQDSHKWVIGEERGKGGLHHYQCRCRLSMGKEEGFKWLKMMFPTAHIEECSDTWGYERKEGKFICAEDRVETLRQRFLPYNNGQETALKHLDETNDREIVCWVTEEGNAGKTWLKKALWERGLAHFVQPVKVDASRMVMDCASQFIKQGYRPYVVIDLPRTAKWTDDMYIAIEMIKDGLISDPRYSTEAVNISGAKVLVLCNHKPVLTKLSADRWVVLTGKHALDVPKKREPLP